MYCWKCGSEVRPGQPYCGQCGASLEQPPQSPPPGGNAGPFGSSPNGGGPGSPPPNGGNFGPNGGGPGMQPPPPGLNANGNSVLTIFALICAVVYGLRSVVGLLGMFQTMFLGLRYGYLFRPYVMLSSVLTALCVLLGIWMCLMLILIALRRTPENSDGLLVLLGAGGVALVVIRFVGTILAAIFARANFSGVLWSAAGLVVSAGGVFAILYAVLGERPILGKDANQLLLEAQTTLGSLGDLLASMRSQSTQNGPRPQPQPQPQPQNQNSWNNVPPQYTPPQYGQPGPGGMPPAQFRLRTDRSLLMYILLSIVTCGLYGWYFIYCLARDVNVACAGDGRKTAGLLEFVLLSLVTCGIYSWIWYYSLGNRLAFNAPRYNMNFQENGTTILLWMVLGSLLCGIGPLIAMYIIIKNTNMLCGAYNYSRGM